MTSVCQFLTEPNRRRSGIELEVETSGRCPVKRMILVLCLAVFGAACGQEDTPPATPTTDATSPEPESPAAAGVTVATAETELGTILTDAEGRTLYVFLNDSGGESACYDDCAQTWPALVTEGDAQAEEGVDASLLGTSERQDGALQVTYNDMPLYYFADDMASGQTNGQGIGDVWYVVSAEGEPVRE
jgi:predicted lipoprotein with Yx(FWY)xxD motif